MSVSCCNPNDVARDTTMRGIYSKRFPVRFGHHHPTAYGRNPRHLLNHLFGVVNVLECTFEVRFIIIVDRLHHLNGMTRFALC
jgi:hypothetical protein